MRRREFITLLSGAVAWPVAARAHQGEPMRRIGVLLPSTADDAEYKARMAAFLQELQQLGWSDARNVRIDIRYHSGDANLIRKYAAELIALAPDVILAPGSTSVGPLLQATRTVPIVFTTLLDPVGAGFVDSLARPGGNATGFIAFEYGLSAKWLELLKQIAPSLTRVAILRDPATAAGIGQFAAIQSVAPSFGVELRPIDMRVEVGELERAVATFARSSIGGLIVTAGAGSATHGALIISLAARHKLPAVYGDRHFVTGGGLISYGPDRVEQYRQAAGYIDRAGSLYPLSADERADGSRAEYHGRHRHTVV